MLAHIYLTLQLKKKQHHRQRVALLINGLRIIKQVAAFNMAQTSFLNKFELIFKKTKLATFSIREKRAKIN